MIFPMIASELLPLNVIFCQIGIDHLAIIVDGVGGIAAVITIVRNGFRCRQPFAGCDIRRIADKLAARCRCLASIPQFADKERFACFRVMQDVILAAGLTEFNPKSPFVEDDGIGFDMTDAAEDTFVCHAVVGLVAAVMCLLACRHDSFGMGELLVHD